VGCRNCGAPDFSSQFPIPNSFPQEAEKSEFSYKYFVTSTDGSFTG
jgi:hypothetical protein